MPRFRHVFPALALGASALAIAISTTRGIAPAAPVTPPAPPQTATAPAIPMDPYTKDLLARLNSADAAQRDAAQKQLANIAGLMQQPEILKRLQETTTEQDLKDFFAQRVVQLRAKEEERRITNLPPLSLKLSGASMPQLVAELNKLLAPPTPIIFENNGNPAGTFTIDVKDKPFWEIFTALQDQVPFDIQNYGNPGMRLYYNGNRGSARHMDINGPAMATVYSMSYQRSINFQSNGTQQPSLSLNLAVFVDPRIRMTRFKYPSNIKVTDDEGRNLQSPNQGSGYNNVQGVMFNPNFNIIPPERLGKTINVSFDTAVTTTVGDTKFVVDDIFKNVDKPFTLANRTIRISNLNGDTNINMNLNAQPVSDMGGVNYNSRIPFAILDNAGRSLYSGNLSMGGMGFGFNVNNAQPPYKIEFSVPGRNFDLPLHFDLKDLPLP